MITKLKKQTWVYLVILLFLFFGLGSLLIPNKPTNFPPYVTNSASPTGVKAFYTFLKNHNDQVQVWQRPVDQLPAASSQLMIMLEPNGMFNQEEQQKWVEWIKKGNDIWLISQHPKGYFNIDTKWADSIDKIHLIHSLNGSYPDLIDANVRLKPQSQDQTVLDDNEGVIALSRSYGKGKLTVMVIPEWFQNQYIIKNSHLQLILPLLEKESTRIIWINDYIHGYESRFTILKAYPQWSLLLFVQAMLVTLMWIWSKGKRFGPIEIPRESIVRFGDERIKAQAAWFQKGEFYQESLKHQQEYLQTIIEEKWGISAKTEDFIDLVKRRLPKNIHSQWKQNWSEINKLTSLKKISHKQFLQYSKLIDDMRKEVQE